MRLTNYVASLALLGGTGVSAFGRHGALDGLLQIPPAFVQEAVNLFPGLHPDHDHTDLTHLIPEASKRMHFSQEGHRPALHGAKHAHLDATFSHPTVILEHSSHIQDVVCSDGHIEVCFNSHEALSTAQKSWKTELTSDVFNLITYHIDCGHLTGERRSYFRASNPSFEDNCVTVEVEFIDEKDAIHAGELSWGTYSAPDLAKRQPARGHVRVSKPQEDVVDGWGGSETANINEDARALGTFFSGVTVNTNKPDSETEGGGFLDSGGNLAKRGLFIWVIEAINSVIDLIQDRIRQTIKLVQTVAKVVVAIAATAVNLLLVPFGVPFDQEYHADISFERYIGPGIGIGSDPVTAITGVISNVIGTDVAEAVYSKQGANIAVTCDRCGTSGDFTFDGKLAFSISEGLTKAQVSFVNNKEFVIEAIIALKTTGRGLPTGTEVTNNKGQKSKKGFRTTFSKEILSLPLTPIYIPGLLTIGPQVVVEPALSAYIDASANITTGPRFTISPGTLTLDAKNPSNNNVSGWKPEFKWVFEMSGNVVATADLALQIGIEVALNVLTGTYKTSAGIFTAPSVYFTAEYSNNQRHKCDGGVELRFGAKNRVYSSVFGLREYEFKPLGAVYYDRGLGCIGLDGSWDSSKVEDTKVMEGNAYISDITYVLNKIFPGQLATEKSINVTDPDRIQLGDQHAEDEKHKNKFGTVQEMPKTHGFRVVQDANQTAILVSGKDGRIYLTDNSGDYDISAPWGSTDIKKKKYNYDVFGRLIYFNSSRWTNSGRNRAHGHMLGIETAPSSMLEMGVAPSDKIPKGVSNAALMAIKTEDGIESFGLALNGSGVDSGSDEWVWLPTFCQVPGRGLQLFASRYIVKSDGKASFPWDNDSFPGFGYKDIATQLYRRDFKDLGFDRKASDSEVEQYAKMFNFPLPSKYADKYLKELAQKRVEGEIEFRRNTVSSRSELEAMMKENKVEVTDANLKFLERVLAKPHYQSCRTVRLISNLKRDRGIVSDLVGGVANVAGAAIGAVPTPL